MTATARTGTSGAVDLTWTPPSSDGGAAIDGYQVSVTTDDGATWTTIDAPTAPPAIESCGNGGTTCRYAVSAHNSAGYGPETQSAALFMPLYSPFMVCGYDPYDPDGLSVGYSYNLLTYDPTKPSSQQYDVDPAATDRFYFIQGDDFVPDCGSGAPRGFGYAGTLIDTLPFWLGPSTGLNRRELTNNTVRGLPACDPNAATFDGCGMLIPIAVDWNQRIGSTARFKIVLFTSWQVWGGAAGYNFSNVPTDDDALGMSCENPIRLPWLADAGRMKFCGRFLGASSMIVS